MKNRRGFLKLGLKVAALLGVASASPAAGVKILNKEPELPPLFHVRTGFPDGPVVPGGLNVIDLEFLHLFDAEVKKSYEQSESILRRPLDKNDPRHAMGKAAGKAYGELMDKHMIDAILGGKEI